MSIGKNIPVKVVGIGGAGNNALEFMIMKALPGVEFIATNTDASYLEQSSAKVQVQMGNSGMPVGMDPDKGRNRAEESVDRIIDALLGARLVIALAGLGKGTGTGASPVVMQTARKLGAVTVAIVTTPFSYEGNRCKKTAEVGLEALSKSADALFVWDNERLESDDERSMMDWLLAADETLGAVAVSVIDIFMGSNATASDLREVTEITGRQEILGAGLGSATGANRASKAVERALASAFNDQVAKRNGDLLLVGVEASPVMAEWEIDTVLAAVHRQTASRIPVRLGIRYVDSMDDVVLVSVVALQKADTSAFPPAWAARAA